MKDRYGNDYRLIIESDDDDGDDKEKGVKGIVDYIMSTRDRAWNPLNPRYDLPHPKYHKMMSSGQKDDYKALMHKSLTSSKPQPRRDWYRKVAGGYKIAHHLNNAAIAGFKVHPYSDINRGRNILHSNLSYYAKDWGGRAHAAEYEHEDEKHLRKGYPTSEISLRHDKKLGAKHFDLVRYHGRREKELARVGDNVGSAKHLIARLYHLGATEGFKIHHPDRHELSDMANRYSRLADGH